MQKLADSPIETCTRCSGSVHKVISSSGLVFKGSGWYLTDYARKNSASETKETKTEVKKETPSTPAAEGKAPSEAPKKEAPPKTP